MVNIPTAKSKQTPVLTVIGSLNIHQEKIVNTIAPILKPISLDGHI